MAASRRKLISDLPRFSVGAVRYHEDEHATIEVTGQFDRSEAVREGVCWLLLPDKENYYGELFSFKLETKIGKFRTHVKSPPRFDGRTFYHLSAYWQAYHVWMVMDASLSWQKLIFQSFDAVSDRIEGSDGQRLTRLRKATPEDLRNPELDIVQRGWDHEHCELCNAHIDPGDCCYYGDASYWVCQRCYHKYVQASRFVICRRNLR
jgi:hypothetical protein